MKRYRGFKWFSARDAVYTAIIAAVITACLCTVSALDEQETAKLAEKEVAQPKQETAVVSEIRAVEPICEPEVEVVAETEPEMVSLGEFKITHYCACAKCCGKWADGYTATGTKATEGRTIAVDPDVIPYGTEVLICYEDGTEHTYIAEDCGGGINENHIDVFMNSHEAALIEGVKYAEVYLIGANENELDG